MFTKLILKKINNKSLHFPFVIKNFQKMDLINKSNYSNKEPLIDVLNK